jgi:hypothetical protein
MAEPYMKDADPDERCQAFNALGTPFQVALLLKSANAKLIDRSASEIRISVVPDHSRTKSRDYNVRCAASIKATIQLDATTFFPVRIGDVAESGCDGEFQPVVHYETVTRQPMVSQFRKGAAFRVHTRCRRTNSTTRRTAFGSQRNSTTNSPGIRMHVCSTTGAGRFR